MMRLESGRKSLLFTNSSTWTLRLLCPKHKGTKIFQNPLNLLNPVMLVFIFQVKLSITLYLLYIYI